MGYKFRRKEAKLMKVTLLGYRVTSFVDDKTGEVVEGTSLFYSFPMTGEGTHGEEAEKKFIRKGQLELPVLEIGAEYDMGYNSKGRLMEIEAI